MNVQEIFILRHGETNYNRQKIVQGEGVDAPLNETGLQQARAFYEAFGHWKFDKIYTSRLKRAFQTVQPFIESQIPFEQHAGLNEINWGHYEGRAVAEEQKAYYKGLLEQWRKGFTHIPIKGGESPEDVALKQQPIIEKLKSHQSLNRILICMHGRAMRVFLCQLLNKPLAEMDAFHHENLSLYRIHLDENNKGHLVTANSREHVQIHQSEKPSYA